MINKKRNLSDLYNDPKQYLHLFIDNATNYNIKTSNNNIDNNTNTILKTKTNNKSLTKIPQIINNYDVKVSITKEKLNNINIKNMNIGSIFSNNIKVSSKKLSNKKLKKYVFHDINFDNYLGDSSPQNKTLKSNSKKKYLSAIDSPTENKTKMKIDLDNLDKIFSYNNNENIKYSKIITNLKDEFKKIENKKEFKNNSGNLYDERNLLKNIINFEKVNQKKFDQNVGNKNISLDNYNQNENKVNSQKIIKRKPKNFTSLDVHKINIFKSSIIKIKKSNNKTEKTKNHKTNNNSVKPRKMTYTSKNTKIIPKNNNPEIKFKYFTNYNTHNNSSFSSENNENIKIQKNKIYRKLNKFCVSNIISLSFIVDKYSKNYYTKLYFKIMKIIIDVQNKILSDCKNKINTLKNELIIKSNELKKYYNACFQLIKFFYSNNYFVNEINRMKNNLQSQILKENEILKNIVNNYKNNITDNKNIFKDTRFLWDDEMGNILVTQKNLMKTLLNYNRNYKTSEKKITAINSPSNSKLVLQDKDIIAESDNKCYDLLIGVSNKKINFDSLFKNNTQKSGYHRKIYYVKRKKDEKNII